MDSGTIIAIATVAYTILTALICVSNHRAASAARAQTKELAYQRELDQRPHIQIYLEIERGSLFCFVICNDGKSAAENVKVRLDEEFIAIVPDGYGDLLRQMNDSELYLAPGQKIWVSVGSSARFEALSAKSARFKVAYGPGDYEERIEIDISQYGFLLVHESGEREIAKAIKAMSKQQKKGFDDLTKVVENGLSKPPYVTAVECDEHQRNKLAVLNAISRHYGVKLGELCEMTGLDPGEAGTCVSELACTDRVIGSYLGTDYGNPGIDSIWFRK